MNMAVQGMVIRRVLIFSLALGGPVPCPALSVGLEPAPLRRPPAAANTGSIFLFTESRELTLAIVMRFFYLRLTRGKDQDDF